MFSKSKKDQAKAGSERALGMFNSAVSELENSNTLAISTIEENQKKIDELSKEVSEMSSLKTKNLNVIKNIKVLLGEEPINEEKTK